MKIKQSNHRGKRTKVVCSNCGEEYLELKTRIKEGRGKFCSNECYEEYRKKNWKDSKEANRLYQKKNKYGLLKEEYYNLFIRQDNKCAICGKEFDDVNVANVDHSHSTNEVRGLLCRDCNFVLGFAHDNISILENAIKYLQKK